VRRWLVACGVVLLAFALVTAGILMVRHQQREAAAEAEAEERRAIVAAISGAGREVASAVAAHNDVQMHFVNMDFYVNAMTPEEEAAPLLSGLAQGHASIASARKIVESAPASASVDLYLQGLDELDAALDAFERYVPVATAIGDDYQRVSTNISAQRDIGLTGYARSEEPMREALKSNADRTQGVELMVLAREHLGEASRLARAPQEP